ncbi:hypothetical protein P167DRAFT_488465 [Morchella conica CCBAS932]|uniref:Tc1-like transposase DDE domain-containing protein n=1 Tax=Morchella conica CCBAS932 TaxID=1392247 RepID=A0A3N4KN79_9PEZI|nr:hypothetical protein P167DRAFT_488465 [Morchella conica CCBAS932]
MPTLDWPPFSPNLNPIENIWSLLKDRLNTRRPRPRRREEIRTAILEEWDLITSEEITKYVDNMPERIQAVIDANGGHTHW